MTRTHPRRLVALTLFTLLLGLAPVQADPQARAKLLAGHLAAEGFTKVEEAAAAEDGFFMVASGAAGQSYLMVVQHDSPGAARAGLVGAVKRIETIRTKLDLSPVSRRRVQLEGAQDARLMRFSGSDGRQAASIAFRCGQDGVELMVVGQPDAKLFKRLSARIVSGLGGEAAAEAAPGAPRATGGAPGQVLATGTGFYISPTEVLTNAHVVAQARTVRLVDLDGRTCQGQVLARGTSATELDLALIKAERPGAALALAHPRNLQPVFAYGYGSLGGTTESMLATEGRISGEFRGALVTTAHVNPGNSGGPLVDALGRAVGVVFMKTKATDKDGSLGLVIPAETAQAWLQRQGVALDLAPAATTSQTPDDARVRRSVVRIELLAGQ